MSGIDTIDTTSATVEAAIPVNETVEGVVKFFSADKGFGFVTPDAGGKDVFIGIGALQRSGLDLLDSGQRVRMQTRMARRAPWRKRWKSSKAKPLNLGRAPLAKLRPFGLAHRPTQATPRTRRDGTGRDARRMALAALIASVGRGGPPLPRQGTRAGPTYPTFP